MWDALAYPVVDREEHPVGVEASLNGPLQALRASEKRRQQLCGQVANVSQCIRGTSSTCP